MSEHEPKVKTNNTPDNSWVEAGYARLEPLMGRVTVLVGKPGTGKTRLLGEVFKQRGGVCYVNGYAQAVMNGRTFCRRVGESNISGRVREIVQGSLCRMGLDEGLFRRWEKDDKSVGLVHSDLLSCLVLVASDLVGLGDAHLVSLDGLGHSLPPKLAGALIKEVVRLTEAPKSVLIATHSPAVIRGLDLRDDSQRLLLVSLKWGSTPELSIERISETSSRKLKFLRHPRA